MSGKLKSPTRIFKGSGDVPMSARRLSKWGMGDEVFGGRYAQPSRSEGVVYLVHMHTDSIGTEFVNSSEAETHMSVRVYMRQPPPGLLRRSVRCIP